MAIELKELIDKLGEAHGTNLKSIVLYGSAVAGGQLDEDAPKKVLVVLDRITPAELKRAHGVTEWWRLEGNPPPLYFTSEEMTDSSDVFPIEFIDMSKLRHVLYGKDPFDGLDISTTNLRHQLEYELRAKLIKLRRLYIPASHNPNRLTRLMAESLDSFAVLFRHVLELMEREAPFEKRECVMRLADALGLDKQLFERLFQCEPDAEVWLQAEADEAFGKYLDQIQRVIDAVEGQ
ncbi:MAG TPA: hypothetical protein VNS63_06080 [Blastocatellia bacterium]|nr:hypothetical protein [Blastocatellia bacterium]